MEIFKLVGKVMVDSADAEKSIHKTGEEASSLKDKLAGGLATAAKWGTAIVGAATAVGGAMVAAAKDTAAELDTIDKASQRMGIAAESYQELAYAANLSGVSMETMEKAAKKLEGTDINFDDALNSIMSLSTEEERAAKASELFGESVAYQMTPLLNAGAEGLEAMKQEANDLGLVMSGESVSAGAAMNDAFTKLDATFSQVKNSIMVELMPYVMNILEWLTENLPKISETVKNVMDKIMPIISPILDGVLSAFKAVFSLLNGDFDGFVEGVKGYWDALVEWLANLGDTFLNIGKNLFTSIWDGIKSVWTSITGWIEEKVGWLTDKLNINIGGGGGISGSHASGLPYVPYDGYKAELHRGEMVLNSTDAGSLLEAIRGLATAQQNAAPQTITIVSQLDGREIARDIYDYTNEITMLRGARI